MIKYIITVIILFSINILCWADSIGINTFCGKQISPVIRGMGDTGVSLNNDISVVCYNPGAASFLAKGGMAFNYAYSLGFVSIFDLLYIKKMGKSTFGGELKFLRTEAFDLYDINFNKIKTVEPADNLYSAFYSHQLRENISWGNKFNYFQGSLTDVDYSYVTVDSGLFYKMNDNINIGGTLMNIPISQKSWDNGFNEKIYYNFETGISYQFAVKSKRTVTIEKWVPLSDEEMNLNSIREVTNAEKLNIDRSIENNSLLSNNSTGHHVQQKTDQELLDKEDSELIDSLLDNDAESKGTGKKEVKKKKKNDLLDDLLGDEFEQYDEIRDSYEYEDREDIFIDKNKRIKTSDQSNKQMMKKVIEKKTKYLDHDFIFSSAFNYSSYDTSIDLYKFGFRYQLEQVLGISSGLIYNSIDTSFNFSSGLTVQLNLFRIGYSLTFHPVKSEHNMGVSFNF